MLMLLAVSTLQFIRDILFNFFTRHCVVYTLCFFMDYRTTSILWKGRKTILRKKIIRMRIKCFMDFLSQLYFHIFYTWILYPVLFSLFISLFYFCSNVLTVQ